MICYGRYSGTDDGWMMFEDSAGNVWEEKASEWEEIIHLCEGFSEYRNKSDGRIATPK